MSRKILANDLLQTVEEHALANDLFLTLREAFETAIGEVISERENLDPSFRRALAAAVGAAGWLDEEDLTFLLDAERDGREFRDLSLEEGRAELKKAPNNMPDDVKKKVREAAHRAMAEASASALPGEAEASE